MAVPASRLDRDSCARGFVRAAQYFANMLPGADVLAESRELLRSVFAADFVCVCQRACEGCHLPAETRAVARGAVDQVFETGIVAMERVRGPPAATYAILPVSVRGRTEAALLIGFAGEDALPSHALESLLGVAGLVGATLARERADRERVLLAEERAARAIAEVTERRSHLLSEVSKALFASFDCEAALGSVARLVVPQLADWCAIDLRDEERPIASREIAIVHADPSKVELVRDLRSRSDPDAPLGAGRVMATGRPELHGELPDSLLEWAGGPEHQAGRDLGPGSLIIVPMGARGGVLGAITLAASRRRYGADDLTLAEELGHRAGTAVENSRLYARAQAAIGVRDHFLAIASHELKTPLAALMLVIGGTERAIEKLPNVPPLMRSKIAALARQGRRIDQLVSNLLDVSRIQAGRLHVSIERVDLRAVVRDVVSRHELEASQAGCAVEVVASEPVTGAWDQSRIDQVVSNLLSNAIKYGAGKPICVVARSNGETALLSVTDHGMGIAPGDRERIFRRFERAVPSGGLPGMGLGLWIVREIVLRLGGSIGVESRLGEGARFTVELPIRSAQVVQGG